MKVYRKVIIDIGSGRIEEEDSFEYSGPVAWCGGDGGGGGGGEGYAQGSSDQAAFSMGLGSEIGAPGAFGDESGSPSAGGWSSTGAKAGFTLGSVLGGPAMGIAGAVVGGLTGFAQGDPASGQAGAFGANESGGGLGGYGGVATANESNPIVETKSMTSEPVAEAKTTEAKKKRGRTENLLTGPLGVLGEPSIERKSLLIRSLRSTLG